jgi:tRNA-splicing ligase RtcB
MRMRDLIQIDKYNWQIPRSFRDDMRVPVRIIATQTILQEVLEDKSLEQAVNSACLPGLVGEVVVMPDMHQGYGFPIGGVAATRFPEGVISPGAIGYDINCGVRLLSSSIAYKDAAPWMDDLASALDHYCPSGVGVSGHIRLTEQELDAVCRDGSKWARKKGYASDLDMERTEAIGRLEGANPEVVSKRAKDRGKSQLGTLGAGNHFIEVDTVDEIFYEEAALKMGLEPGILVVQIHCGSRGFGHQVCTDYVQDLQKAVHRYGITLPDRSLVCAPMDSREGQAYLAAMRCAANYAFANRQLLAHFARQAFEEVFAGKVKNWHLNQVYDLAHNIGKIETHKIEGEQIEVCVHRKGATRAFGPNSEGVPDDYKAVGQPVLVPGSMGTSSWVLTGTDKSMEISFGTCCHGAGRVMSRRQAKKLFRGQNLKKDLGDQGISIRAGSMRGLAEEAPLAYKDVDLVVNAVTGSGIAKKVARLKPVAVVKG